MTSKLEKGCELDEVKKPTLWSQWLAGVTVNLAVLLTGLANGWTSPYLARLTAMDNDVSLTVSYSEASWVASLLNLGRVIGGLIGGFSQELLGRKRTMLLASPLLSAAWIFIIVANSVEWLFISRFLSGIAGGMIWSSISLYLGEIADPSIRGSLISMTVNTASVGLLIGNIMGPYLQMETYAYICLIPNFIFLIAFSFIPESPYHYIMHNEIEKAEESLKWYRRESDVKGPCQELQDFIHSGTDVGFMAKLREFSLPANKRCALLLVLLNAFVYTSGHISINSYAEIIVRRCDIDFTPSTVVIGLGSCTVLAGFTAVLLVDKLGRRFLLMMSGLGVSLSMLLLGLHFHFVSVGYDYPAKTWLPIISLVLFNMFISYGFLPVTTTLIGEIFPQNLKSIAACGNSCVTALMAFFASRTFQPYVDAVGDKFVFWTYSMSALSSVPFVYFLVPETKGKSLMEIQKLLTGR